VGRSLADVVGVKEVLIFGLSHSKSWVSHTLVVHQPLAAQWAVEADSGRHQWFMPAVMLLWGTRHQCCWDISVVSSGEWRGVDIPFEVPSSEVPK